MTASVHVIGGHGFIGSALVRSRTINGDVVSSSGRPEKFGPEAISEYYRSIVATHDWIVHAASGTTPASSNRMPITEIQENLLPFAALIEALQSRPGCRLLYISSAGTTYADDTASQPTEEDRQAPRSYHGAGKVAAEYFLRAFVRSNDSQVVIVRPTNVYGPGQTPRAGFGLISTALARCLDGGTIPVFGSGSSIRDYLYIDDFVSLLASIISQPYEAGLEIFNAANGQGHSVEEVLATVEEVSGRRLHRTTMSSRAVDAKCVVPNPYKAQRRFGWTAGTSLAAGIGKTWDWFSGQHQL